MQRKKVLIVDDDEELVRILCVNLQVEGFDVCTAFDGMSAVMRAHKDQPDLIILDIKMPAGDGFSVVERLKSSNRTFAIPVVFLSALPKEDHENKAKEVGVLHYFAKPFNMETLINYIKDRLDVENSQSVSPA
jgi:DNA-binding response OmpR family regulator